MTAADQPDGLGARIYVIPWLSDVAAPTFAEILAVGEDIKVGIMAEFSDDDVQGR
jgi:hypothetical protein